MKKGSQAIRILLVVILAALALVLYQVGTTKISKRTTNVNEPTNTALPSESDGQPRVHIGNAQFSLLVADTSAKRTKGLGGRSGLPADTAMLFVFDKAGQYGIWMKDMQFAIDIVWFDTNGCISKINNDIAPDTYPTIYYPPTPALYILEMGAGSAATHGLQVGMCATFEGIGV